MVIEVFNELTVQGEEVMYCFRVLYLFCASGEHHTNITMYLSPLILFHAQLGSHEVCDYIRQSILTSVWRRSALNDLSSCFVHYFSHKKKKWFLGVEQFHQSFHTFILFILVFFSPPNSGLLFQPPLFPHQIPSLHNYHLLILNESPNTLHGFNTAC